MHQNDFKLTWEPFYLLRYQSIFQLMDFKKPYKKADNLCQFQLVPFQHKWNLTDSIILND